MKFNFKLLPYISVILVIGIALTIGIVFSEPKVETPEQFGAFALWKYTDSQLQPVVGTWNLLASGSVNFDGTASISSTLNVGGLATFTKVSVSQDLSVVDLHATNALIDGIVSGNLNMSNYLITNIGHANTDFTSGGGLNIQGNVGIGTLLPTAKLSVDGTASVSGQLTIQGNVGIGTTGPQGKLHIQTNIGTTTDAEILTLHNIGGLGTGTKGIIWRNEVGANGTPVGGIGMVFDGTSTNFNFHSLFNSAYKTTSDVVMTIKGTGNVGIGTTAPLSALTVKGNLILRNISADAAVDTVVGFMSGQARTYGGSEASGIANIAFRTDPTTWYKGGITFSTNNVDGTDPANPPTEKMRITASGNVGIGDTSPAYKLSVDGTASVSGTFNSGAILPTEDNTFDLGSDALRWKDIYATSGSIHLGDIILSNDNGELVIEDKHGKQKITKGVFGAEIDGTCVGLEELEKRVSEIEKDYITKREMMTYILGAMIFTFLMTLLIKRKRASA